MWHVGDIAEKKKCKTGQHEKMAIFNESNPDSYRSIYGSLFSEFGEEITTKIHRGICRTADFLSEKVVHRRIYQLLCAEK